MPDTVIRHADFASQHVIPRHVDVWLPAEYAAADPATVAFPVLYMHDGQNLFDPATSSIGVAWEVDQRRAPPD
jgi:predicted alpha/beta superfamily hydrolase